MIVNKDQIHTIIPQRAPIIMIDELLYCNEQITRTKLSIDAGNIFCDNGVLSEAGIIENIAQTAAARVGFLSKKAGTDMPIGFIAAIKDLSINILPRINSEIITEVTIVNEILGITIIHGKSVQNDRIVAQCEMRIFLEQNVVI